MSRFYQKYLSGLKSKGDSGDVGKKIDPTSMMSSRSNAASLRVNTATGMKGEYEMAFYSCNFQ